MPTLTRRAFLAAAALLASAGQAFGLQTRAAARPITRGEFIHLSERLVGRKGLDTSASGLYLDALLADPANGARLARLARAAAADEADRDLERTIIECWYTGTYTRDGERRIATHTGVLMWAAIGVTPPSICGGLFGAWSEPPRQR